MLIKCNIASIVRIFCTKIAPKIVEFEILFEVSTALPGNKKNITNLPVTISREHRISHEHSLSNVDL